jgi:hypothetical protein
MSTSKIRAPARSKASSKFEGDFGFPADNRESISQISAARLRLEVEHVSALDLGCFQIQGQP